MLTTDFKQINCMKDLRASGVDEWRHHSFVPISQARTPSWKWSSPSVSASFRMDSSPLLQKEIRKKKKSEVRKGLNLGPLTWACCGFQPCLEPPVMKQGVLFAWEPSQWARWRGDSSWKGQCGRSSEKLSPLQSVPARNLDQNLAVIKRASTLVLNCALVFGVCGNHFKPWRQWLTCLQGAV